ncbi:MAG: hypothetical protein RIB71_01800, partial [Imperialibacter sp.]
TNKRIQGHICLCYIAYSLLNQLQLRLIRQGTPLTEQTIRTHLSKMQVSLVKQADQYFYLRSKTSEISQQLLQAVAEKNLPDLLSKEHIIKYL